MDDPQADPFMVALIEEMKKPLTEEQIHAAAQGCIQLAVHRECCGDPADCNEDCC